MKKIAVLGLGYVGLPLAVEFAKKYPVTGFDINLSRVNELKSGHDSTLEVDDANLLSVLNNNSCESGDKGLYLSANIDDIRSCDIYIVTVPTPIDKYNRPDLTPLIKASETVGQVIGKGNIVIYESTVYPGATEEDCIPVIEKISRLVYNKDFFAAYSPERINPGDKVHTVTKIKKVTSGSNPEVAKEVDELYKSIIEAGTHMASSIRVAEASKVIENSQRDINIAFVNELSVIFNKMGIDTLDVLEAAGTKWNFLPFRPGLVGGHCIGIDPYYLTHKAQEIGYNPEIILAGRRLNDSMGFRVAGEIVKLMIKKEHKINGAKILVLGITFKENCPDIRNSRVIDVIEELKSFGCKVDVYDPWADYEDVKREYNIELITQIDNCKNECYDAVVLAVSHNQFKELDVEKLKSGSNTIIYDIKGLFDISVVDGRL